MATDTARHMVTEWGMSDTLGPLAYGENTQEVFLGHSVTKTQNVSEATSKQIDLEIRKIVDGAYERAHQILTENLDELHTLAKGLLEYETLSGEEIQALLAGQPITRTEDEADQPSDQGRRTSVPTTGKKGKSASPGLGPEPQPET